MYYKMHCPEMDRRVDEAKEELYEAVNNYYSEVIQKAKLECLAISKMVENQVFSDETFEDDDNSYQNNDE